VGLFGSGSGLARLALVPLLAALGVLWGLGVGPARPADAPCPVQRLTPAYVRGVEDALRSGPDVWGNQLLRSPAGPTYAGAARYLEPLLLVGRPAGRGGTRLTDSGVYYLAFGQPSGGGDRGPLSLHVADGSEIVSEQAAGPSLAVDVGPEGHERYGSCLARLSTPQLYGGYLPILETRYRDAAGDVYRQESFAARLSPAGPLVSFVRLSVEPRGSTAPTEIRFVPSPAGLRQVGTRLERKGRTYAVFSPGGEFDGSSLAYPASGARTVYAAWVVDPVPGLRLTLDAATYARARQSLIAYWNGRLAQGTVLVVPERRVLDAERNLLIQNLEMGWRYSLGNDYEAFEPPESLDGAVVIGEYGFGGVDRGTLQAALGQPLDIYPSWQMGDALLSTARYYRLYRDRAYVAEATPVLGRYVARLRAALAAGAHGLLPRGRYASDLPQRAYALDSQAVAWAGLRAIGQVWAETGRADLAGEAGALAARLGAALIRAVQASARRLPDGSLFVPVRLLDGEAPYANVTSSRSGSYWNLVIPYALASGLLTPGSAEARGVLAYLLGHGSRLLGLVRFNYYPVAPGAARPGGLPGYRSSGADDVYGLDLARFLVDNDVPDQLVLNLYGQLAAGMTIGTFVSGEGSTIAPVPGEYYRSMYLPPNSLSNATFLETLRLMLIHETTDAAGVPAGLELAYATPRAWLRPGQRILVRNAPTSFGRISFTIAAAPRSVRVHLEVPAARSLRILRLRLRTPSRTLIASVSLDGRAWREFDPAAETIDLSGRTGSLSLVVRLGG
jgi:hypothetical protein